MSNAMKYVLSITEDGEAALTVLSDGEAKVIDQDHPNFSRALDAISRGENLADMDIFDLQAKVIELDDRVSIDGEVLLFDGEPIHDTLARTILRYYREGRDPSNLVKFLENLAENPSMRSREQLWTWVADRDLTVTDDGCFVGYKGVRPDGLSCTAGPGIVNGEPVHGHLDNSVGNVIQMKRTQVMDDPAVACSAGLHVGTYQYASGFGQRLLEVKVNPRDVVSVPSDSGGQKLRCCEYTVLKLHDLPEDNLREWEPDSEWDDEETWETWEEYVPATFFQSLKNKVLGRS